MTGPGGMIVRVPAHGVGVREPADKGGQFAVLPRPEHRVPAIGHQAVGQQADGASLPGLGQHTLEGRIVLRLLEQRQPGLPRHGRKGRIVENGSYQKGLRPLICAAPYLRPYLRDMSEGKRALTRRGQSDRDSETSGTRGADSQRAGAEAVGGGRQTQRLKRPGLAADPYADWR